MNSILIRRKILQIAFLVETICVTYALKLKFLTGFTSVAFTVSGLFLCWFALVLPGTQQVPNQPFDLSKTTNKYRWWILAMTLICIIGSALHWMEDAPLDYHDADMLPIIKIMSERFIHGPSSHVYDIIPEIWGGMHPIYLPAMWMPFSIPVFFNADPRWTTVAALFILASLFIWRIQPLHRKSGLIFFAAFLLIWWLLNEHNSGLLTYTEEGVVILFYSLLALALLSKNGWLIGMATSLCVLSRYSLVGWIPAMLIFYIYTKDFKNLLRIALMGLLFFIVLVLIPFGWSTFLTLTAIPSEYISFSERVWKDAPVVFHESLGFAKFFGPRNIALQHHLLIFSALVLPTLFMVVCLALVKRFHLQKDHLPIATLKFTLVIFYTLVDVPYLYLFYTGSFLSLFLVTNLLVGEKPIWALKKTA